MSTRNAIAAVAIAVAGAAALVAQDQQYLAKLPPPYATRSADNHAVVIKRPEGSALQVPQGFQVEEWASGFEKPRYMLLGPHNEVLLSDSAGTIYVLTGATHPQRKVLIKGLNRPYGLAFWKDYLYVGEQTSIHRYKYDAAKMTVGKAEEIASFPSFTTAHWTRSVLFDPKGEKLYVGIGSGSNDDPGDDPRRAAVNRYNPDGSGHEIYASGTRNPIGLHWYPGTDTLWAAVQERDTLGDDLVPDYFTHIQQGGFYGWPYAYSGPHEDPINKGKRPDLVKKSIPGDVLLQSHVAVLDFTFYTGKQFPQEYRGGAFLALHGSWNRSKRVGYSVVFIPFANGKPSGPVRNFLTGWMISPTSKDVWGRPVAVLQMPDGSLLVSDDGGKKIWRISYKG